MGLFNEICRTFLLKGRFMNNIKKLTLKIKNIITGTIRDVTDYIHYVKRTEESELNYKLYFEKMADGYFILEPVYNSEGRIEDVRIVDVNPAGILASNISRERVIGKTWFEIMGTKNALVDKYERLIKYNENIQIGGYLPLKNRYFNFLAFKISDDRIGCVMDDITERKMAEDSLKLLNTSLEAILNSTDDMIWLVDENFNCIISNPALDRKIKKLSEIQLGSDSNLSKIILEKEVYTWKNYYRKAVEEGNYTCELEENGSIMEVTFNPIYKDDENSGVAVFSRNITARRMAERELEKMNLELEERVSERTRELLEAISELEKFTYIISHDLKAPLKAQGAYLRIISEDYPDILQGDIGDKIEKVVSMNKNMITMINKLLLYTTSIDRVLHKEIFSIRDMIKEVFNEQALIYYHRDIRLNIINEVSEIKADKVLFRTVIENIIANAIKFTRDRKISVITIGCERKNGEVAISIKDNGVGFNPEYAWKLFNVFERLHSRDEFEGSGIGLATVRKVIELHEGRVTIEGSLSKGVTVYLYLPDNDAF
jgi:PAS domain S-box-containing protein